MKTLRAAFATNDGEHFINEHYGDAEKYVIYDISQDSSSLVATVANKSKDFKEEGHADPNKAMGIAGNFREHKPQLLVNKAFGGNILRMKKKFLPVLVSVDSFDEAIALIRKNFDTLVNEYQKGEERKHLRIK